MATSRPSTDQAAEVIRQSAPAEAAIAAEGALVQARVPPQQIPDPQGMLSLDPRLGRLPVELDVTIPVKEFRVRNLLALVPEQVIETQWAHGEDMPLAAGDAQLAWSEFEVVESFLAVRITRLA